MSDELEVSAAAGVDDDEDHIFSPFLEKKGKASASAAADAK